MEPFTGGVQLIELRIEIQIFPLLWIELTEVSWMENLNSVP